MAPGGIVHTSGPGNGYQDYACSIKADINTSANNIIEVQTFNLTDNVTVWIDYNNNGSFETTEKVFERRGYTVTFSDLTIPPSAVKGVYLRIRVISQRNQTPIADACQTVQNGEIQDYAVRFMTPPVADFGFTDACTGTIAFADSSLHNPTSWLWTFGNPASGVNNTSTLQNPSHTFTGPGSYVLSLRACNSFGCNTVQKRIVVGVNPNISLVPACKPKLAGHELEQVIFGNINHTSLVTVIDAGYQDYSCQAHTTLIAGNAYPLTVKIARNYPGNAQAWIDYNNNGIFETAERIMQSANKVNHTALINIPASAIKNTYLRMRVRSDSYFLPFQGPCTDTPSQTFIGQAGDFAVKIVDPIGIAESSSMETVKLYPNPNNGIFTLELPEKPTENYELEVLNVTGNILSKQAITKSGANQLSLKHLPKGIYLLKITSNRQTVIKKLVIE